MERPLIEVGCALIVRNNLVLAVRRSSPGPMRGRWEFPGGKLEAGETAEACIRREIREELGIEVEVRRALPRVRYSYPEIDILLHPFVCGCEGQSLVLRDHDAEIWDKAENLRGLDWTEADVEVLENYLK
jgi:8-oxo-dGTP diphosphatase